MHRIPRSWNATAAVALTGLLLAPPAPAATPWVERLTTQALSAGADAQLPPHLSVILGVTVRAESTPVRQLVARVEHQVHTFNVCASDHRKLVVILADEQSHRTTAYLVSTRGKLLKTVAYSAGQPAEFLSATGAQVGFARERRYWSEWQPR